MIFKGQRRFVRGLEVVLEMSASKILHTSIDNIHYIVKKEWERFRDDFVLCLTESERLLLNTNEQYAFTLSGLMMIAIINDDGHAVKIIRAAMELKNSLPPNDKLDIFDLILKIDQE